MLAEYMPPILASKLRHSRRIFVPKKSAEHPRFLSAFPPQFPAIIAVFLRLFPYLPNSYYLCSGFKLGANLEPL